MAWVERYVRADADGSGDGTTDANSGANGSWTFAQAVANYAAGQRVNIKAGSYSGTTFTLSTAGTTTAPVLFRGYKSTIGDMDESSHGAFMSGTEIPAFGITGRFTSSVGFIFFQNIDVQSSQTTNAVFSIGGSSFRFTRCRIECTSANANGRALSISGQECSLVDCWLKSTQTATNCVIIGTGGFLSGSTIVGGASGLSIQSGTNLNVFGCVFDSPANQAILGAAGSNRYNIANCIFYNTGSDAIRITTAPLTFAISGCLFSVIGGIGINNNSGTDTANAIRNRNAFYSITTGQEAGFGDTAAIGAISLSADPFVDAASGDFNINSTAGGGQELRDALVVMPELSGTSFGVFRRWLDPLPSGGGGAAASVIGAGGLVF